MLWQWCFSHLKIVMETLIQTFQVQRWQLSDYDQTINSLLDQAFNALKAVSWQPVLKISLKCCIFLNPLENNNVQGQLGVFKDKNLLD